MKADVLASLNAKHALKMLQNRIAESVELIERPFEIKPAKEEFFREGVRAGIRRAVAEIEMEMGAIDREIALARVGGAA